MLSSTFKFIYFLTEPSPLIFHKHLAVYHFSRWLLRGVVLIVSFLSGQYFPLGFIGKHSGYFQVRISHYSLWYCWVRALIEAYLTTISRSTRPYSYSYSAAQEFNQRVYGHSPMRHWVAFEAYLQLPYFVNLSCSVEALLLFSVWPQFRVSNLWLPA